MRQEPTQPGMSRDQVAQALGISRETVRTIERSALAKIRRRLERRGLAPESTKEPRHA